MIYSECVAVALVFQHAKWMRRIILSPVACPSVPYFSTFSHKRRDFREKKILNIKGLILSQTHISLICDKQCHNSKFVIFQEKHLKVLKCYNLLRVQRLHNCSPAASIAICVIILYLLTLR